MDGIRNKSLQCFKLWLSMETRRQALCFKSLLPVTRRKSLPVFWCMDPYGCFQKSWISWYPQIIHFNRVFHYTPSNLGGKIPLFLETSIYHHIPKRIPGFPLLFQSNQGSFGFQVVNLYGKCRYIYHTLIWDREVLICSPRCFASNFTGKKTSELFLRKKILTCSSIPAVTANMLKRRFSMVFLLLFWSKIFKWPMVSAVCPKCRAPAWYELVLFSGMTRCWAICDINQYS